MKRVICENHHYYNGDKYEKCPFCGSSEQSSNTIKWKLYRDKLFIYYTNCCGNCHKLLEEDDKYCRYCGTRRGEGAFEPYDNVMKCIYGPMPVERTHRCPACGHSWKTVMMIDNQRYCPVCGAACTMEEPPRTDSIFK